MGAARPGRGVAGSLNPHHADRFRRWHLVPYEPRSPIRWRASLVKSAIFFAVGHAAQKAGTQAMEDIRGLAKVSPTVGWGLMIGTLAILGMPPFGVFASEFLILTTAMREHPWATPILLIALGVAFAAVFSRVQPMVFGDTHMKPLAHQPALVPVFVHLGLGLMLGLYNPPYLAAWYQEAARLLG